MAIVSQRIASLLNEPFVCETVYERWCNISRGDRIKLGRVLEVVQSDPSHYDLLGVGQRRQLARQERRRRGLGVSPQTRKVLKAGGIWGAAPLTFGYPAGGVPPSFQQTIGQDIDGTVGTPASSGTLTDIYIYVYNQDSTPTIKAALYDSTGSTGAPFFTPVAGNLVSAGGSAPAGASSTYTDIGGLSTPITAATAYWILAAQNGSDPTFGYGYDNAEAGPPVNGPPFIRGCSDVSGTVSYAAFPPNPYPVPSNFSTAPTDTYPFYAAYTAGSKSKAQNQQLLGFPPAQAFGESGPYRKSRFPNAQG